MPARYSQDLKNAALVLTEHHALWCKSLLQGGSPCATSVLSG